MRSAREYRQASKATYNRFVEENPSINITYTEYQNIIYAFNYAFRDYLLETGEKAKLPWGIGNFAISKRIPIREKTNPKTGEPVISLPVDWKKTRELGYKVYHLNTHTEGYKFRVKWFISSARFKMCEIWTFKPNRITSRLINHYIRKDPPSQHRYQEWHLLE